MTDDKPNDTRRLLKVFGVAVTNFESEGGKLSARIAELGGAPNDELLAVLRDLLELFADTNRKWHEVTAQLKETESRILTEVIAALGE